MPKERTGGTAWALFAGFAVLLGVASLAIPVILANLPGKWSGDPSQGFFMPGGTAEAQNITNPYHLQAIEYGGKYAIVREAMAKADLDAISQHSQFQAALAGAERLTVFRSEAWTVVFAGNSTLKEALGMMRLKPIGDEFAKTEPLGFSIIKASDVPGLTITKLVGDNLPYIVIAAFLIGAIYTLVRPNFPMGGGEAGEDGEGEGV